MHLECLQKGGFKHYHIVSIYYTCVASGEFCICKTVLRRFINILAEDAGIVAAWMVPRMRGVRGSNKYFKCAVWLMRSCDHVITGFLHACIVQHCADMCTFEGEKHGFCDQRFQSL